MSSSLQLVTAIRNLGRQLTDLALPAETDELMTLVVQQKQLLEAYVQLTLSDGIDYQLIREVSSENRQLIDRVKRAHHEAAQELDALALARTAVSAYAGFQPEQSRV